MGMGQKSQKYYRYAFRWKEGLCEHRKKSSTKAEKDNYPACFSEDFTRGHCVHVEVGIEARRVQQSLAEVWNWCGWRRQSTLQENLICAFVFFLKNSFLPNCPGPLFFSQPGSLSIELKTATQDSHLCVEPTCHELLPWEDTNLWGIVTRAALPNLS